MPADPSSPATGGRVYLRSSSTFSMRSCCAAPLSADPPRVTRRTTYQPHTRIGRCESATSHCSSEIAEQESGGIASPRRSSGRAERRLWFGLRTQRRRGPRLIDGLRSALRPDTRPPCTRAVSATGSRTPSGSRTTARARSMGTIRRIGGDLRERNGKRLCRIEAESARQVRQLHNEPRCIGAAAQASVRGLGRPSPRATAREGSPPAPPRAPGGGGGYRCQPQARRGGDERTRTAVRGFAGLCPNHSATSPRKHRIPG